MEEDFRARDVWFDIPAGSVPDMACGGGRDGVSSYTGSEYFRPEYFTVEIDNGRMMELRLWGRQIKKDGSLGVRHLDYLWQWS
jgi:hypothetical protein